MRIRPLVIAFAALGCLAAAKVEVQGMGTKGRPAPTVGDLDRMDLVRARATRPFPRPLPPIVRVTSTEVFVQGTRRQSIEPLQERGVWSAPRIEEALRVASAGTDGHLVFVVNPGTTYRVVKKLMFLANKQGFTRIDFAVRDEATGKPALLALKHQPAGGIPIGDLPSTRIFGSLDPSIIDAVVKGRLADIQSCHENRLKVDPTLQGKMVVNFVIAPDGSVSESRIKSSTMGSLEVEACVSARFKELRFPTPKGGGTVTVNYPLLFKVSGP